MWKFSSLLSFGCLFCVKVFVCFKDTVGGACIHTRSALIYLIGMCSLSHSPLKAGQVKWASQTLKNKVTKQGRMTSALNIMLLFLFFKNPDTKLQFNLDGRRALTKLLTSFASPSSITSISGSFSSVVLVFRAQSFSVFEFTLISIVSSCRELFSANELCTNRR